MVVDSGIGRPLMNGYGRRSWFGLQNVGDGLLVSPRLWNAEEKGLTTIQEENQFV